MLCIVVNFATAGEKYEMKGVFVLFGHVSDVLLNAIPFVESCGPIILIHEHNLSTFNDHAVPSIQMYDNIILVWILFEQSLEFQEGLPYGLESCIIIMIKIFFEISDAVRFDSFAQDFAVVLAGIETFSINEVAHSLCNLVAGVVLFFVIFKIDKIVRRISSKTGLIIIIFGR